MRYCLTDTGLGANTSVNAINEYAFVGCAYLADIGLGTSERIVSIGNFACEDCKSLRLTNPEVRLGYDFGPTITGGVQFPLFPMASIRAASMLPTQAKS